ncbi:MAG TPA: Beta-galactosidase C-terminal domain, partial [Microbacterium sp.]|nr:Beta-galactosidase C-terminal domain [Microbacterium sp.]
WFSDFAAVTTNPHGSGRITVVGTVPSPTLAARIVAQAIGAPSTGILESRPDAITVASGATADARFWFVFNWGWKPQTVALATEAVDAFTREPAGGSIELPAWGARVLRTDKGESR